MAELPDYLPWIKSRCAMLIAAHKNTTTYAVVYVFTRDGPLGASSVAMAQAMAFSDGTKLSRNRNRNRNRNRQSTQPQ